LSPKIPSQFQRRPAYLRRKKLPLPNAEEAEQVDERGDEAEYGEHLGKADDVDLNSTLCDPFSLQIMMLRYGLWVV